MKTIVTFVVLASIVISGCADPIQAARISSTSISAGASMAQTGINIALDERQKWCKNKYNQIDSVEYKKCVEESKEYKAQIFYAKLYPQIKQAVKTLDASIEAATQKKNGEQVDFTTPIKHAVCLLTQVVEWLPAKWQNKVKFYVDLVGNYTCGTTSEIPNNINNIKTAKELRDLLLKV